MAVKANGMEESRIKYDRRFGELFYSLILLAVVGGATAVVLVSLKDKLKDDEFALYGALGFLAGLCVVNFIFKSVIRALGLNRDRGAVVMGVAGKMDFSYDERLRGSEVADFASLPLFQPLPGESGVTRKITNVMTGTRAGVKMMIADYEIGHSKPASKRLALSRLGGLS